MVVDQIASPQGARSSELKFDKPVAHMLQGALTEESESGSAALEVEVNTNVVVTVFGYLGRIAGELADFHSNRRCFHTP